MTPLVPFRVYGRKILSTCRKSNGAAPSSACHSNASTPSKRRETAEHVTLLDAHLKNKAYVIGDAFSMGYIPLGAVAQRWITLNISRLALPALAAWYQRLRERPAFVQHVDLPLT